MLSCLSHTLHEIHRLSREASVGDFQEAAFEAMRGLIRFDVGYRSGLFAPEDPRHIRHSLLASAQVVAYGSRN